MTHSSKPKFEVQAGKRYNRRDGGISETLKFNHHFDAPFTADGWLYGYDGRISCGDEYNDEDLISEYIEEDEYGPWIGWNGGDCPVDAFTVVMAQMRNFSVERCSESIDWDCRQTPVIAYRVKQEPPTVMYRRYFGGKLATVTVRGGKISIEWDTVDDTE